MLEQLAKHHDKLLELTVRITNCKDLAQDVLQDAYLKLHDSGKKFEEINDAYIYFAIKSVFLDTVKKSSTKNRFIPTADFLDLESEDVVEEKIINYKNLTNFDKLLIPSLFGKEIVNENNQIVKVFEGSSMLNLSRQTGIPYRTIYTTVERLKTKICLKESEQD